MTYKKEAEMVREFLAGLVRRRSDLRFRLYDRQPGDDPGFSDWFRSAGVSVEWHKSTSLSTYIRSFDDVALGLAPLCRETPFSRGKSFGKVLAYLDRHVPVICSDAGEHSEFFGPDTGIVSNHPEVWIVEAAGLLDDWQRRQRQANAAFSAFRERLSLDSVGDQVSRILHDVVARNVKSSPQIGLSASQG